MIIHIYTNVNASVRRNSNKTKLSINFKIAEIDDSNLMGFFN